MSPTSYLAALLRDTSLVPRAGLEPARNKFPQDFKSCASTDFATKALLYQNKIDYTLIQFLCQLLFFIFYLYMCFTLFYMVYRSIVLYLYILYPFFQPIKKRSHIETFLSLIFKTYIISYVFFF